MKEVIAEYAEVILGTVVAGLLTAMVWGFLGAGGIISTVVQEFINSIC